jgi:two-component sensor histidine kinase
MEPRRILIVDDDPDTRALVRRAIAAEFPESELREATDRDTLEAALQEGTPDILITDFDLRWSTGLEVFEAVKGVAPDCCTLMFTGSGNEELAVQAMKRGFDDYIVKRSTQLKRLAASARLAFERYAQRLALTENRDLVLKELYHRLHNNLQIVVSLLRMTERAVADATAQRQLQDLRRRVEALGTLQEAFYRSPDFRRVDIGAFLETLAPRVFGGAVDRIRLTTEIAPVTVPIDRAVSLGLIASELMTGALEEAADGPADLFVALEREDGAVVVTVRRTGPRAASPSAPDEVGARLVERLAGQIEAEIVIEADEAGTTRRIKATA